MARASASNVTIQLSLIIFALSFIGITSAASLSNVSRQNLAERLARGELRRNRSVPAAGWGQEKSGLPPAMAASVSATRVTIQFSFIVLKFIFIALFPFWR